MAEDGQKQEGSTRSGLQQEVRRFIVELLACYEPVRDVIKAVKTRFDVVVDDQQVRSHDPTKARGQDLAKELKRHFKKVRTAFDKESEKDAVGNIRYRLSMRRIMLERAMDRGDYRLANEILKGAAEDKGGRYTNRREMSGPDGGPIKVSVEDKKKAVAARMLRKLSAKMPADEARRALLEMGVDERDLPSVQSG